jgi:hypothetical protein
MNAECRAVLPELVNVMSDPSRPQRLESRIPANHPLRVAVESAIEDALAGDADWSCRILASTAVTCWIVEFVRASDGHREDVVVQPSRFDPELFRKTVAAAVRPGGPAAGGA